MGAEKYIHIQAYQAYHEWNMKHSSQLNSSRVTDNLCFSNMLKYPQEGSLGGKKPKHSNQNIIKFGLCSTTSIMYLFIEKYICNVFSTAFEPCVKGLIWSYKKTIHVVYKFLSIKPGIILQIQYMVTFNNGKQERYHLIAILIFWFSPIASVYIQFIYFFFVFIA